MAFLANPTARFTHCASPAGSAAGPGGRDAPWQTVDQAIAAVPSTCTAVGGALPEVRLLGSAASPSTYVSAGLTVRNRLTIVADEDRGAKLAGNGTSEAILLANGANLTLRGVRLDPSLNGGGPAASGITVPNTFPAIALTCTGVLFENWTDHALNAASSCRINVTQTDCDFVAGSAAGGVFLNSYDGAYVVRGGSCTIGAQNTIFRGAICVNSHPGSTPTVDIQDFDTSITLDPSLTGSGPHYGIRLVDVLGASRIAGGYHEMLGAPGARTGYNLRIEFGAQDISGSSITGVTTYNNTNGGIGFGIGQDGQVARGGSNCAISGTASAGPLARAGGHHGAFLGCLTNSTANVTVTDVGLGFVDKGTSGTVAVVDIEGFSNSGIRSKGSKNASYSGRLVQTAAYSTAIMIDLGSDGVVTTDNAAYTLEFVNNGSPRIVFAFKYDADSATPVNNVYNQNGGGYSTAGAWQWGSTVYNTLADWKAAVEASASGTAP